MALFSHSHEINIISKVPLHQFLYSFNCEFKKSSWGEGERGHGQSKMKELFLDLCFTCQWHASACMCAHMGHCSLGITQPFVLHGWCQRTVLLMLNTTNPIKKLCVLIFYLLLLTPYLGSAMERNTKEKLTTHSKYQVSLQWGHAELSPL